MEQHHGTDVVRRSGEVTPFNAGDVVAAVCDMYELPIPPSIRARIGKSAKGLLDAGFDPNTICAAAIMSVRMARPGLMDSFALEMQNAQHGLMTSFPEYRAYLQRLNDSNRPELEPIVNALKEAFK